MGSIQIRLALLFAPIFVLLFLTAVYVRFFQTRPTFAIGFRRALFLFVSLSLCLLCPVTSIHSNSSCSHIHEHSYCIPSGAETNGTNWLPTNNSA